jgi:tetrapyrrole methylase family protein/MazG family protein
MSERFQTVVELMAALRAPDGCPWDRKQTHESLKPYLLEETYEVLEILDRQDRGKLAEELGMCCCKCRIVRSLQRPVVLDR